MTVGTKSKTQVLFIIVMENNNRQNEIDHNKEHSIHNIERN